ncbi:MAG TPA: MoxR family ATPase [Acidilobales archaeon]|nr:MoxR family ATPase [Acidilobales archaeon]
MLWRVLVLSEVLKKLTETVSNIVVGHEGDIKLILSTLLAGGHVLIYGLPGSAKTLVAKLFAEGLGLMFKRIQFTPDMLPADIVGAKVIDPKTGDLRTLKGPIFTNILLADEINRSNPKTLSALIEAMQESQVTIEGETYNLPKPFMVIATINPIETQGIYQIPQAILDRFMVSLEFLYPTPNEELEIMRRDQEVYIEEREIETVINAEELQGLIRESRKIHVTEPISRYILNIINGIRSDQRVFLGPSPRATLHVLRLSKIHAYLDGRTYVIPDDVKYVVKYVLRHRIIVKNPPSTLIENFRACEGIIEDVLNSITPP